MTEETKLKKFKELIFNEYHKIKTYDKINYQLLRCREILLEKNYLFSRMSTKSQFSLCSTVLCIVIDTTTNEVRKLRIITKNDNESDLTFSVIAGYKKPEQLEISEPKRKLLK